MKHYHIKRLQKLADFLRTVPKRRFNMNNWFTGEFCGVKKPLEPDHHWCNSAACALGWACYIPSFKKAGLRIGHLLTNKLSPNKINVPEYRGMQQTYAGMSFFGLDYEEAMQLFGPCKRTPLAEVKVIEKVIAKHSKP